MPQAAWPRTCDSNKPLVDFEAVLVLLLERVFSRQSRVARHQTGDRHRGIADQMLDADEFGEIVG